jgi:two-component system, OmpR family, phosphate regulon sensor histidine kinase PhoR
MLLYVEMDKERRKTRKAQKPIDVEIDLTEVLKEDFWNKANKSPLVKNLQKFNRLQEKTEYEKIIGKAMIENLDEGVVFINNDKLISIINENAKLLLGFKRKDDLYGRKYDEHLIITDRHGNKITTETNPVEKTFLTSQPQHIRVIDNNEMVRRDGSTFPINIATAPVIINKNMKGVVLVFQNASREKAINQIKSDFISIASHQLRTPVAVSTLESEMLLAGHYGELNKEQRKSITEILRYNKKMTYLLDVFMSVSKIELDKFQINPRPTDLRLLMDDIINDLLYKIKKKRISLRKQYDFELPVIDLDPELVRIIFQNLIANAINYTQTRGNITIGIEKKTDHLMFYVSDNGFGIPEKDQGRLFTKLYRSDKTKKLNSEGSGLGLYITKSIVDKCHFEITFKSKEDVGTTFFVKIPIPQSTK